MPRKDDADQIAAFLAHLSVRIADGELRTRLPADTPSYLYHLTPLGNTASIAKAGALFSRRRARERGIDHVDAASPEIIAQTNPRMLDFVRLYFRPRTPTFYRNEGIRPRGQEWRGAHMPVPVALLFDAAEVLSTVGAGYSNRNLASRSCVVRWGGLDSLRRLPFDLIYHDDPIESGESEHGISSHRQAEAIVRDELPLVPSLRRVLVRSDAELVTLRTTLLRDAASCATSLLDLASVDTRHTVFVRQWTFVERVVVAEESVLVHFHGASPPSEFELKWSFTDGGPHEVTGVVPRCKAAGPRRFPVPSELLGGLFGFSLWLDDHLAYDGTFDGRVEARLLRPLSRDT